MAKPGKLTQADKDEIVRLFYDEGWKQKHIAEKFEIQQSRVSDIVNAPECLMRMLKRTSAEKVRAQMKINHHLLEAADTQIELMRGTYEDQYKYLKQNAARDILDRGGVRAEKDEGNEMQINVSIGGGAMVLGTPDHSRDNDEDALSRDNEEAEVEAE